MDLLNDLNKKFKAGQIIIYMIICQIVISIFNLANETKNIYKIKTYKKTYNFEQVVYIKCIAKLSEFIKNNSYNDKKTLFVYSDILEYISDDLLKTSVNILDSNYNVLNYNSLLPNIFDLFNFSFDRKKRLIYGNKKLKIISYDNHKPLIIGGIILALYLLSNSKYSILPNDLNGFFKDVTECISDTNNKYKISNLNLSSTSEDFNLMRPKLSLSESLESLGMR